MKIVLNQCISRRITEICEKEYRTPEMQILMMLDNQYPEKANKVRHVVTPPARLKKMSDTSPPKKYKKKKGELFPRTYTNQYKMLKVVYDLFLMESKAVGDWFTTSTLLNKFLKEHPSKNIDYSRASAIMSHLTNDGLVRKNSARMPLEFSMTPAGVKRIEAG